MKISKESMEIIVSVLVNDKIEAEKNNENGINDAHIEAVNNALMELRAYVRGGRVNASKENME